MSAIVEYLSVVKKEVENAQGRPKRKARKSTLSSRRYVPKKTHAKRGRKSGEVKLHECNVCFKYFTKKCNLQSHVLIHTGVKPYQCDLCSKRFTERSNLAKHLFTHTGAKTHHCELCSKSFTKKDSLSKHMLIHTGKRPFRCLVCSKAFRQNGHLSRHLLIHAGDNATQCTLCPKRFTDWGKFQKHIERHWEEKQNVCEVCSKVFPSTSGLLEHARSHLGDVQSFMCERCCTKFADWDAFSRHMQRHEEEIQHVCKTCGETFPTRVELLEHEYAHLVNANSLRCSTCYVKFEDQSSLLDHACDGGVQHCETCTSSLDEKNYRKPLVIHVNPFNVTNRDRSKHGIRSRPRHNSNS